MKWYVRSPMNGWSSFASEEAVLEDIKHELEYYKEHDFKSTDFDIFWGNRHEYQPPTRTAKLVNVNK